MKPIICWIFLFSCTVAHGQYDLSHYLDCHHYSFSLEQGFEGRLADTLYARLTPYRLILQAEGGSHYLTLYNRLELDWLMFLHARMGLIHFVGEAGVSDAVLANRYLQTRDGRVYPFRKAIFLDGLFQYNQRLSIEQRLIMTGIDFERPVTYVMGLKMLLPASGPPATIGAAIGLIRQASDSGYDCNRTLRLNNQLKKALTDYEPEFKAYLGDGYTDFEKIVRNNGSCKDPLRNRNDQMADNFLALDRELAAPVYYGEFGEAHTILKNRDLASIINGTEPLKGKVAVVNLYCYACSTPKEEVSNWPLKGMEKDILQYFLPLCEGDYTLFDLSAPDPLIASYRAYGQFLIIAKGQH